MPNNESNLWWLHAHGRVYESRSAEPVDAQQVGQWLHHNTYVTVTLQGQTRYIRSDDVRSFLVPTEQEQENMRRDAFEILVSLPDVIGAVQHMLFRRGGQ
jgi:hypothetical protein